MIRTQTFFTAVAVALSFSAAVASASTEVPSADDAQRLTIRERPQLHLNVKEVALQQIEWQRQLQRQLQERERIKSLTVSDGHQMDDSSRLQVMAQNRVQTQEQTNAQAHVRTRTQTQARTQTQSMHMDALMSGAGSSSRGSSGRH